MFDARNDGVYENPAGPGQAVAEGSDKSQECNTWFMSMLGFGGREKVLGWREVVFLEYPVALVIPDGEGDAAKRREEDRGLFASGGWGDGRVR